ncbi:MAG: AMP-binding protein [Planctomycetota bacterium]
MTIPGANPRIRDRLAGQHLLVTGSTGFLAKAFVEKLLRSVDTIGGVHLLIRPGNDGVSPRKRLERDVIQSHLFHRLRAALGERFTKLWQEKLHVVGGDLTADRFGLPERDYDDLTRKITLVVNSAATVTFDERLDWAIQLNAQGPKRPLQLAKDCGNVPFLHVSTCYVCGARGGTIVEDFSAPEQARESLPREIGTGDFDLDAIIAALQKDADHLVQKHGRDSEVCRKELIDAGMRHARSHGWNDTYTFTKWIGEQLLLRDHGDVPLIVFRPAIIESSYDEPVPGWIDGLRMADPVIAAYGRGKLRDFPGRPDVPMDLIPVDFVVNGMLAALHHLDKRKGSVALYQSASSDRRPLRLRDMGKLLESAFRANPMNNESGKRVIPAPLRFVEMKAFLRAWENRDKRLALLRQWGGMLPDADRRSRKSAVAARQIQQIIYFAKIYAPYTHLDVRFAEDHLGELRQRLHPDDLREFPFDVGTIDWEDYLINRHIPGLRSHVLGGALEPGPRIRATVAAASSDGDISSHSLQAADLFTVFGRVAARIPDKPALRICRQGKWIGFTYQQALQATGSILQRLHERGLTTGDRVAICSENGPEWGLTYLAIMRGGMTAVPIDPQMTASDVLRAVEFVGARLLCAGPSTYDTLRPSFAAVSKDIVPLTEPFIPLPGASRDRTPDGVPVNGTSIASILFTSGTTSDPRAVPLTHQNLIANAQALASVHPILANDEFLSVLPMYHVFEFTAGFLVPLAAGATITYVEQLKGPEILAAMQATGTTIMLVVPRLLQLFHDSIERQVASSGALKRGMFRVLGALSATGGPRVARRLFAPVHKKFGGKLRMFVSGGARLDPELWHAFHRLGFIVHEGYGMTETAPVLTCTPQGSEKPGSVGPPLPNVQLEIRNQNLEGVGEVWVKGPNVMSGYWNNPEATRECLENDWLRTGDLGRFDADGFLLLTGRCKDLIISGAGKNVYPDEVETKYGEIPNVKELCVFGLPAENGMGDIVHAAVVVDPDTGPELDRSSVERAVRDAIEAIGESIPTHQRIQSVHFWLGELPKTTTLKAKRQFIRDTIHRLSSDVAERVAMSAPRRTEKPAAQTKTSSQGILSGDNPATQTVRAILANASKRPESAIHADLHLLLDLGIDSIGKIDVLSAVESAFDTKVDDETSTRISRVGDLFSLVAGKTPVGGNGRGASAWRRWFAVSGSPSAPNGVLTSPWIPARWLASGFRSTFMHTYIRVHTVGLENVPKNGPFILAPNHASHLDAPAILTALRGKRRVWVAAAEDYFFNTASKRIVFGKLFDAIPFDRQADGVQGLRKCGEALGKGDGLLLFPEGTRSLNGRIQPFKIGAVVLAVERNAPIIPVYIHRAFERMRKGRRLPSPGPIGVTFGPSIAVPSLADNVDPYPIFQELTRTLQRSVAELARSPVG